MRLCKLGALGFAVIALALFCGHQIAHDQALARALPTPQRVSAQRWAALPKAGPDYFGVLGTGSMQPLIPAGLSTAVVAYVRIKRPDFSSLRAGELVIYQAGSALIVHQLCENTAEGWIVSGSHNQHFDRIKVTAHNLIGVVAEILLPDALP